MRKPEAVRLACVGCGALVEGMYAPALRALEAEGALRVTALMDPSPSRREAVRRMFPKAQGLSELHELSNREVSAAVIASPACFHAEQAVALLSAGIHVLCEKPMASSVADARRMVEASAQFRKVLSVGLFRRFFPTSGLIRQIIAEGSLGELRRFDIHEGGPFGWPAATPSFFDSKQAGGGVLLDLGVHVLDLLSWWLGEPDALRYSDDSVGGLEANCRLELGYGNTRGRILLSRDFPTQNTWRLEFADGVILWRVGNADEIELRLEGTKEWLVSRLEVEGERGQRYPADTYRHAFSRQIADFVEAVCTGRPPLVCGAEGIPSLRLIERCYQERKPMQETARP